ncbi:hypothetical protein AHAS_Ahas05G0213400 [Arachis hypogaea]
MKHFQIGLKSTLIATDLAFNMTLLQAFKFLILQIHLLLRIFENSLSNPIPPELGNLK